MNHQSWTGFTDARFGYGAMLKGFLDHSPAGVRQSQKASVQVYMGVPVAWKGWWDGQHRVLFTMWETTELPSSFKRYLPLFDQVLVPCEHNRKVFAEHHQNVSVVPLGVDTGFWTPQPRSTNPVFRIHAAGSLWRRKGLDALVDAFVASKLDAELHIKAAPHALDVPDRMPDRVFLHRQWMSIEEQRDWFNQSDVFVAPSRGEGFGLIPLQAIALGVPTIVTATSGQAQFAHLATAVCRHRSHRSDSIGYWDEPDRQHLASLLVNAFENRQEWRDKALALAPQADQFTWDKAVDALLRAVPEGRLLKDPGWEGAMVETRVVALRDVRADIGNKRWVLRKGEETMIPDGVYQVLYDNGAVQMV